MFDVLPILTLPSEAM